MAWDRISNLNRIRRSGEGAVPEPFVVDVQELKRMRRMFDQTGDPLIGDTLGVALQLSSLNHADPIRFRENASGDLFQMDIFQAEHYLQGLTPSLLLTYAQDLLDRTAEEYRSLACDLLGSPRADLDLIAERSSDALSRTAADFDIPRIAKEASTLRGRLLGAERDKVHVVHARSAPTVLHDKSGIWITRAHGVGREQLRAELHAIGHAAHFLLTARSSPARPLRYIASSEVLAFLAEWHTLDGILEDNTDRQWHRFLVLNAIRRQAGLYQFHHGLQLRSLDIDAAYDATIRMACCFDEEPRHVKWSPQFRHLEFLAAFRSYESLVAPISRAIALTKVSLEATWRSILNEDKKRYN